MKGKTYLFRFPTPTIRHTRLGPFTPPRRFGDHRGHGVVCNQPSGPIYPKRNKRYIFPNRSNGSFEIWITHWDLLILRKKRNVYCPLPSRKRLNKVANVSSLVLLSPSSRFSPSPSLSDPSVMSLNLILNHPQTPPLTRFVYLPFSVPPWFPCVSEAGSVLTGDLG